MNGDAPNDAPEEPSGWQYKQGDPESQPSSTESESAKSSDISRQQPVKASAPTSSIPRHPEVSWGAVEFIAHKKSPLWYLSLIAILGCLASLVYFLGHDKVSTVLIIIIGIITAVAAGRQPRDLQYLLDSKGITVNRAFRPYSEFKSFAVVRDEAINTIVFMPMKRFTLPLSLNVGSDELDAVVAKVSDHLPNDQSHGHDALDRFAQRIHF